jgi:hypothetical protein
MRKFVAALGIAATFGISAGSAGIVSAAVNSPSSHKVACAVQEDSVLTDCHGHRLDYRHGGWYAPGAGNDLPAGYHWAPGGMFRHQGCIIVWAGQGDTVVRLCKAGKGKAFVS